MVMAGTARPLLEVAELTATRPGGDLLGPVNLTIMSETITAFVGPTGSGREDLIGLLTGIARPRSGQVVMSGQDVTALSSHQLVHAGIVTCRFDVPQHSQLALKRWLLLAQRLVTRSPFGLLRSGLGNPDMVEQNNILAVLEFIGLRNQMDERVSHLTPGNRRLASLAAALVQRPRLLIVERVFHGLNGIERRDWTAKLTQLRNEGLTLIINDDCPAWLADMSDYMVVMAHGRVMASGTPDAVGNDPAAIETFTGRPVLA